MSKLKKKKVKRTKKEGERMSQLQNNSRLESVMGVLIAVSLATSFTLIQLFEYTTLAFDITDGVYGAIFYLTTGFHWIHIIVGTAFLSVAVVRLYYWHFTPGGHFGFEAAA